MRNNRKFLQRHPLVVHPSSRTPSVQRPTCSRINRWTIVLQFYQMRLPFRSDLNPWAKKSKKFCPFASPPKKTTEKPTPMFLPVHPDARTCRLTVRKKKKKDQRGKWHAEKKDSVARGVKKEKRRENIAEWERETEREARSEERERERQREAGRRGQINTHGQPRSNA